MNIPPQTEFPVASALLDFLIHAEKRPGMYYGSLDPRDIQRVLSGWRYHRHAAPDDDPFADRFFAEFHAFVAERYAETRSIGWAGMIAERMGDGAEAYAAFMSHLRAFVLARVNGADPQGCAPDL